MVTYRIAVKEDTSLILEYIKRLACFEKMEDEVEADTSTIEEYLINKQYAHCLFILENNKEIGYMIYFFKYSTFYSLPVFHLEDLYIDEEYRHKGYGREVFEKIKEITKNENCCRIEWQCLDWNRNAINFYDSLNAKVMDEWLDYRLEKDEM